ncbi:MAG: hypothetical protein ACTHK1_08855 [Actinomycetales bacterium]
MRARSVMAVALLGTLGAAAPAGTHADSGGSPSSSVSPSRAANVLFRIADPAIGESSALAVSTRIPDVLWTLNDSGNAPILYALDRAGRTAGTIRLDVDSRDWEALTVGPGHTLWVGDIGDNSRTRSRGILVHRLTEPAQLDPDRALTVTPTTYRLRYPDGPHDAEALLVEADGSLDVITKDIFGGAVYRADRPNPRQPTIMRRIADAPPIITDATQTPDGRVILRSYTDAYVYDAPGGRLLTSFGLPAQPQGEGIASDSQHLYLSSEGLHSAVLVIPLPRGLVSTMSGVTTPPPTRTPSATPLADGGDRRSSGRSSTPGWLWALGGAVLGGALLAGVGAANWRRRRHPREP